jgi:hypothetical protein
MFEQLWNAFWGASCLVQIFVVFAAFIILRTLGIMLGFSGDVSKYDEEAVANDAGCFLAPILLVIFGLAVADRAVKNVGRRAVGLPEKDDLDIP